MQKSLVVCLSFVVSMALNACGNSGSKTNPGTGSKGDATKLSSGFAQNCTSCHGAAGGGASARSIQGYTGTISSYTSAVRNGKGSMPSFSTSSYSDENLNADYTYLKSL